MYDYSSLVDDRLLREVLSSTPAMENIGRIVIAGAQAEYDPKDDHVRIKNMREAYASDTNNCIDSIAKTLFTDWEPGDINHFREDDIIDFLTFGPRRPAFEIGRTVIRSYMKDPKVTDVMCVESCGWCIESMIDEVYGIDAKKSPDGDERTVSQEERADGSLDEAYILEER